MMTLALLKSGAVIIFITGFVAVFGDECQLPPDSGSCAGATNGTTNSSSTGKEELRYYYSAANFKCTQFPYSGCGGNANNFKSLEECKRKCSKTFGSELPIVANIVAAQAANKCYYGNRTYSVPESIPGTEIESPCSLSCFCGTVRPGKAPQITCAEVDCPPYPEGDDCVPIDKNNACCTEYYCPSTAPPEEPKPFTCTYKGKTYVEHQTIQGDYPCIGCKCTKNWKGYLTTEGGVCKEVNCGLLIHNQQKLVDGCIPKFYTTQAGHQSCCPIEFNCKKNKKTSS